LKRRLRNLPRHKVVGKITSVKSFFVEAKLPGVSIGDFCFVDNLVGAEVVGFREGKTLLMAYDDLSGVAVGSEVEIKLSGLKIPVGSSLLGAVIDPFGRVLNDKNLIPEDFVSLKPFPINPLERDRIREPLDVGVQVINALLTVGKGQRIGLFAGAGVGKSTLLGMISRFTEADVNVVALIGERGREVREFIEDNLGKEGLSKSVVIVATSDMSPLAKVRAAHTAFAIAEYFSSRGKDVLLLLDSLTRFAMAQREIGLSVGEPPTSKGYTPSVFSSLAKLVERAGNFSSGGSITAIFTVLVEGDDLTMDPVADAAVGLLDGHIILSREMANKRLFPAVDVLKSISRLAPQLLDEELLKLQSVIFRLESVYSENRDLIQLGLYKRGSSPLIDLSIYAHEKLEAFIRQDFKKRITLKESFENLKNLVNSILKEGERYGYRESLL